MEKQPSACPKCGGQRRVRSNGSWGGKPRWKPYCAACDSKRIARTGAARRGKKRWNESNPEKRKAHKIVENAVASGRLEQQPCERCGAGNAHAHHDDYSKPLEVKWLCPQHHKDRHREIEAEAP